MRLLLFDLFSQFLNGVVVWRIGRQLDDVKPCCLLGEEGLRLSPGMILRPILNADEGLRRVLQDAPEKGNIGSGVEAPGLPLVKEVPSEGRDQAQDLVAFALA